MFVGSLLILLKLQAVLDLILRLLRRLQLWSHPLRRNLVQLKHLAILDWVT